MITFEVNIICDGCGEQCVTGTATDSICTAIDSAREEAKAEKWAEGNSKWFCPECCKESKPE